MKVLVISHTYITQINRDKWKILAQRHGDVNVLVVVPQRWSGVLFDNEVGDLSAENMPNCSFMTLPAVRVGNEVKYGYSFKQLLGVLKQFKPDVIHIEQGANAYSYFQVMACAKLLQLKSKYIFFTWINWRPKDSLKYWMSWGLLERINLAMSHGAVAGNQDAKELLQEKGFSRPVLVLPQLGVNTSVFYPGSFVQTKTIGFIGRIVDEKGVFLLLDAFKDLAATFPDWKLHYYGKGEALGRLKDEVQVNGLHGRVTFYQPTGHDKIADVCRGLDILVLPSFDTVEWKEQFGHVLIEAMACSVPVIGSTGGEIPNVLGDAGLIFEQKNKQSLLEQMRSLMQDESLRLHMGRQGYQRVQQRYSCQVIADKTYQFWREIWSR